MKRPYNELIKISKNKLYITRYIKFIEYYSKVNISSDYEKHHIFPRSLFPEYSDLRKNKWNKVNLPMRAHYLAHYMLAKAIGNSMWFAFNQMSRVKNNINYNSYLYETTRRHLKYESSKLNSGREMSCENKRKVSERFKNTVNVRDEDGNCFNVSKNDPQYLSGELVHVCKNNEHTIETKQKMSDNGIKGKKAFTNSNGEVRYFDDEPTSEWVPGNIHAKNQDKDYIIDTVWVTVDGKSKRVKPQEITAEMVQSRIFNNNGFDKINSMNKVFDLETWQYKLVDEIGVYQIKHGSGVTSMKLYCYNNILFSNYNQFENYCTENKIYTPHRKFKLTDVKKPHHNMKFSNNLDSVSTLEQLGYHFITKDTKNFKVKDYIIYK